jgi:hypothetical protein
MWLMNRRLLWVHWRMLAWTAILLPRPKPIGRDQTTPATRCSSKTNYTAPTSLVKSKEE